MATVPLRDIVVSAQSALEEGDLSTARAACQHVLAYFPCYADMHRIHGEIALEQGDVDGARRSFEQVLTFDPQNVLATLGLGVIAEESNDLQAAASYFQQALEIDPSFTQLRDELVRIYSKLYGQGGRLHPSSGGLAAIYARGNQLTLAQKEYAALTARHPNRLDLALALAEVRWRAGDDGGAQQLCQGVLAARPQAVRALYILADLFRRHGALDRAREAFTAGAAVDPIGAIARLLETNNPTCSFAAFTAPPAEIPAFDPSTAVASPPAAPALPPASALPAGAAGAVATPVPTTNSSLGVTPPPVEETEWQRLTSELSLPSPTNRPTTGGISSESIEALAMPTQEPPSAVPTPTTPAPAEPAPSASDWPAIEWEHADAELEAARPTDSSTSGYTDILREIDSLGVQPFDTETEPATAARPTSEPAASLAPPIDDAAAALQEIVGNWDSIDDELAAATPTGSVTGFEDLAAELDQAGFTPFGEGAPAQPPARPSAEPPISQPPPVPSVAAPAAPVNLPATPPPAAPLDISAELEAIEAEGLRPFDLDELEAIPASSAAPTLPPWAIDEPRAAAAAEPAEPLAAAPDLAGQQRAWSEFEAELEGSLNDNTPLSDTFPAELEGASLDTTTLSGAFGSSPHQWEDEFAGLMEEEAPAEEDRAAPSLADLEAGLDLSPLPAEVAASEQAPAASEVPPAAGQPSQPPVAAPRQPVWTPSPPTTPRQNVQLGSTISLGDPLFERLRSRKRSLLDSGSITRLRPAPVARINGPVGAPIAGDERFAEAERRLAMQPEDHQQRLELAGMYAEAGRPAEAAGHYRLLLRAGTDLLPTVSAAIEALASAFPNDGAIGRLLGDLYMRQGRYSQAMNVYRGLLVATLPA